MARCGNLPHGSPQRTKQRGRSHFSYQTLPATRKNPATTSSFTLTFLRVCEIDGDGGTEKGSRVEHPADTHLNTCAVLSQIGRHQGALEHAQSALILLQEELFGGGAAGAGAGGEGGDQPPRADRIAVLAIAYHNMGVEQEFLKKFEHSLQSYRKGVEVTA